MHRIREVQTHGHVLQDLLLNHDSPVVWALDGNKGRVRRGRRKQGKGEPHRIGEVQRHGHVLQDLLGDRVGALELQQEVGLEDVLDQGDVVLSLLLREAQGRRGLEGCPQVGQLGYAVEARVFLHLQEACCFDSV